MIFLKKKNQSRKLHNYTLIVYTRTFLFLRYKYFGGSNIKVWARFCNRLALIYTLVINWVSNLLVVLPWYNQPSGRACDFSFLFFFLQTNWNCVWKLIPRTFWNQSQTAWKVTASYRMKIYFFLKWITTGSQVP